MKRGDCRRARRSIVRDWDQRISLDEGFRLEEHLADCAPCAELAERHAQLDEAFARLPEPPAQRIDLEAVVAAVRSQVELEPRVRRTSRPRPLRRIAIATVALAAAVLLLARLVSEGTPPGSPGAGVTTSAEELALNTTPETPMAPDGNGSLSPNEPQPSPTGPDAMPRIEAVQAEDLLANVPAPPDASEFERLDRARTEFRAALLAAGEALAEPSGLAALDAATQELRDSEWPLRSLAEGLLSDPEAAPAAIAYLGWRGNRRSAKLLARDLGDSALAPGIVVALERLGPEGATGLGSALAMDPWQPVAHEALEALVRIRAADELARVLRRSGRAREEQRAELVSALARAGGLADLLALGAESIVDENEWLAGLAAAPRAADELAALAARTRSGPRVRLLLAGVAAGRHAGLLPWIESLAIDMEYESAALEALAAVGGVSAARSWLRLAVLDRIDAQHLDETAARLTLDERDGLVALVADVAERGDRREAEALLSLCSLAPAGAAAPALVAYAAEPTFADDWRQWAVLTAGERGVRADTDALAALLGELDASDRLLAAAVLQALYALGGDEAVWVGTEGLDRRTREELVGLFSNSRNSARGPSGGGAVTLLELARRVGPALPDPRTRRTQP